MPRGNSQVHGVEEEHEVFALVVSELERLEVSVDDRRAREVRGGMLHTRCNTWLTVSHLPGRYSDTCSNTWSLMKA
jgi:hypothetical protein